MRGASKQRRKSVSKAKIKQFMPGTTLAANSANSTKDILVLISAILLFIAAAIGLYIAWDSLSSPNNVVII